MKRFLFSLLGGGALGLALLTTGMALRSADPPAVARADPSKQKAEAPVERLVAGASAEASAPAAQGFVNPKAQPGLVHWHPSFDAACRAARRSGKPVLLFQMMGRLDEKFC